MKTIISLFFLIDFIALVFTSEPNNLKTEQLKDTILKDSLSFNIRCFLFDDYNVYDLGGLSRPFKDEK